MPSPGYLSGIQDLLSEPPREVDASDAVTRVNRVDDVPLSSLVEVYAERVERRSSWLNAELLPAAKRERPIRHVLGPRPLPVILEAWLAAARAASFRSLVSVVARMWRKHALLRTSALVVVVAVVSSLTTLLVTRW